jgi:hypothetical protein
MNFQTILEELDRLYEEDLNKATEEETVEETVEETEEAPVEEACGKTLTEDADVEEAGEVDEEDEEIEIVDDEAESQVVLECTNCGALAIKAEADVKMDDEVGVANADEACQFCEEAKGYKVLGTFSPIEPEDVAEDELEEEVEVADK